MNYKEILKNVVKNGSPKQPTRLTDAGIVPVENATIGLFGQVFEHDMSEGFPLSGLRRLPFKSTCVELEFFLSGRTDKRWLDDRGCSYWEHWAAPYEVERLLKDSPHLTEKEAKRLGNDLGPLGYSYELRQFGGWNQYGPEVDQLWEIVSKLKKSPYDRRMVASHWNPASIDDSALPPCHVLWNVVVYGDTLNLWWHQRSVDILANQTITTYGLLLLLLCKESGLNPGRLMGSFADCHIYLNQLEAAKTILERDEPPLPTVEILPKEDGTFSIFDWEHTDVLLRNYTPHDKVNIGAITV